jgi:hypothetical protein
MRSIGRFQREDAGLRFACLGGEPGDADVMEITLRHAIGRVRKSARQNLLRRLMDACRAGQLHNECANLPMAARNLANKRQGYRTVKTAAIAVRRSRILRPRAPYQGICQPQA